MPAPALLDLDTSCSPRTAHYFRRGHLARWLGVGVVALLAGASWAQGDLSQRMRDAADCYARFDYDCVIDAVGRIDIREAAESYPRVELEMAVRLAVVSYVVRGVPERARVLFFELLDVYPDYRLTGDDLAPRFFRVFEEARAMHQGRALGRDRAPVAQAAAVAQSSAGQGTHTGLLVVGWARALAMTAPVRSRAGERLADIRLGLGVIYQRLTGSDAQGFDPAFGVIGRLATERLAGLLLELSIDWQRHEVIAEDLVADVDALSVLTFSAAVLYPWRIGAFLVGIGLGVGYTTFGFESAFERGGPSFDAIARGRLALGAGLGLDLDLRYRIALAESVDGIAVSSPLQVGLLLTFDLSFD